MFVLAVVEAGILSVWDAVRDVIYEKHAKDFSGDCATSQPLCCTHGSILEEFEGWGKEIFDFRDFRSAPAPDGAWEALPPALGGII